MAAEERSLKDLEREKLDQELLLKSLEGGQLELKDRKTILDVQTGMSESVRDYNNAVAAQELAQSVIDFANKNESLATFGAKIGASVEDIKAAIGANRVTNVDQLSDTKRAQIALDILANRNIKEILGESGRTISNIDRDIANRIIGNLSMRKIQSVAELKNRLGDNIKSIIQKKK